MSKVSRPGLIAVPLRSAVADVGGRASPGARRPTLGLLVDWLEDEYQNAVLCGVDDVARAEDVSLICFTGGTLDSPHRMSSQRNVIYDLAGPENVDGLLVMAGTLGNTVGPERLASFCERYRPLPMCSIAWPLPHIPSVLVDNATGMREALIHLIEHHGHRRIAFIRGPARNTEAARRFRVYQDVLAEHDITPDPILVTEGDFQRPSGREAIATLLDQRRAKFDALVAASDYMALGAMDALHARGLRIPDDVAVVGFDDVEEAQFNGPPLTTVRQPLVEQGVQAAHNLLAQLRGEAVPDRVVLHTELVRRHSCGCFGVSGRTSISVLPGEEVDFAAALARRRSHVLGALAQQIRASSPGMDEGWEARLLDSLVDSIGQENGTSFTNFLSEKLEKVREHGGDLAAWHAVLTTLRRELLGGLGLSVRVRTRLEDLIHEGRGIIATTIERAQAQARLNAERWARTLSRTGEALITAFDVISLVNAVAEQFPRLRIDSCFLSLYEDQSVPWERARLVLSHPRGAQDATGSSFPSRWLAPRGTLPRERRYTYVVEPLFFKDDQLGFALFEVGPREGVVYEALRDEISAAIKGALLVQQVVEKDQERQRLLRDLEKRARQLEEAYDALKQNQEKLLIQEKMASLGRLTASIAHEMNTPLAASRTALIELEKLVDEYISSVGDPEITRADHEEIAGEMRRAIRLAASSARRASDYVRGIKTQTRDLLPSERQLFNAVPFIQEALLLLSYSLRQADCSVTFEPAPGSFELAGSPGRLAQIVTNLVTNAIDASAPKGGGVITLELERSDEGVLLRVTDNGRGIPPEVLPRIFEPMFTTKPFGQGTGLGLSIVRDVVTRDFGGSVDVASTPGLGTTFTVTFPSSRET